MLVYQRVFPTNLAHRNSWFTYEKWRFSSSQTVNLPECIPKNTNQRSNIVETLLPENGSRTERICFSYFVGLNIAILQETIYVNHPLQTHFHNFNHDIPHRILPSTSQNSRSFVLKITLLRVFPTMTFIRFVTGKSSGIRSGILSGKSSKDGKASKLRPKGRKSIKIATKNSLM